MTTVMLMEWSGITPEQYKSVMTHLKLDTTPPRGAIFHVAGFTGGTMRVLDLWDSQQAFETFQKERLEAAVKAAGITTQPTKVEFFDAHNIYAPSMEFIRKAGASSIP